MSGENYDLLFIDQYIKNAKAGIHFLQGMYDCYIVLCDLINKYKQYLVQTDGTKNDQQRYQRYRQYIEMINQINILSKNNHSSDINIDKFLYCGTYLHKWIIGYDGRVPHIISFQCKSINVTHIDTTKHVTWGSLWEDHGPGNFINRFTFSFDHEFNEDDLKLFTDEYVLLNGTILNKIKIYMIEIKSTIDIFEKTILYLGKKSELIRQRIENSINQ